MFSATHWHAQELELEHPPPMPESPALPDYVSEAEEESFASEPESGFSGQDSGEEELRLSSWPMSSNAHAAHPSTSQPCDTPQLAPHHLPADPLSGHRRPAGHDGAPPVCNGGPGRVPDCPADAQVAQCSVPAEFSVCHYGPGGHDGAQPDRNGGLGSVPECPAGAMARAASALWTRWRGSWP